MIDPPTTRAGRADLELPVRDLRPADVQASAAMHLEVLGMEFLARFGAGFLAAYHRAWVRSPAGLALGVEDADGRLAGVMLGSLDPAAHYPWMLRRAGAGLAVRLAAGALRDPALARDLVATRATRYLRAVWRQMPGRRDRAGSAGHPPPAGGDGRVGPGGGGAPGPRAGEITHLMVAPGGRGGGAGRALVEATEARARAAGEELVLVTPPDLEARGFYRHLGWQEDGELSSRSGEQFVRFRRRL